MNRQFLFIKSATESIALPVDSFSHAEYTSDTTVSVYFDATRSGKDASVKVVLTVSSGKANDVVTAITNQVSGERSPVLRYDDVKDNFATANVTGITSITTTEAPTITGADGVDGTNAAEDKVFLEIRTDEAVSKGDPLYITGYNTGQSRITVGRADAADSSKMPSIGLSFDDYAINTNGRVITIGSLVDVDTSSFSVGDVLYVAATGGLTATKPTGTNLIQNVGKVGRSNANNGEIVVMAIGRSNDVPNIPDGQVWIGNSSGVATPTSFSSLDENLGNTDLTLSADRTIELDGNDLLFDNSSTQVAKIFANGTIQATSRIVCQGNGTVGSQIRLNDADSSNNITLKAPDTISSNFSLTLPDADGSSGEVLKTDGSGTLSFTPYPTKFLQVYNMNFFDDLGTTKHYLPWKDINEQTLNYQDESALLCPFDGRVKSVAIKFTALAGTVTDGNMTIGIETVPTGSNVFSGASWTIEETETISVNINDDNHTFHFVFDDAQHFEAGDSLAISIQNSADITGNSYAHAVAVVEFDTSTDLGSSSTEHETNP